MAENSSPTSVGDIVRMWLIANGYDGICCPGECACVIDDLAPCDAMNLACVAGHREDCDGDEDCPLDGDCDFHIVPGKRA